MAFHPDGTPSEQADELVDREPGLTEDRSQSSPCQFPVERQNDHPTVSASQLHVAAPLADLLEATPCERLDGIRTGDDRERRAHAERRKVAMIGGSNSEGSTSSSKYSSRASFRLESASSTVAP